MKTIEEKTRSLMTYILSINAFSEMVLEDEVFDGLQNCISTILKEQDRDTRHACAENVLRYLDAHDSVKNEAHSIIMNTREGE